jgi:hypothetical protein
MVPSLVVWTPFSPSDIAQKREFYMLGRLGVLYEVRYFLRCRIRTTLAFCISRSGLITCPILHALPPRSTRDKHERVLLLFARRRDTLEHWTGTLLTQLSLFGVSRQVFSILRSIKIQYNKYFAYFDSVDANPQQILPAA